MQGVAARARSSLKASQSGAVVSPPQPVVQCAARHERRGEPAAATEVSEQWPHPRECLQGRARV